MIEFDLNFDASYPCLAGHFPGNPVVPAVVLLDHIQAWLDMHSDYKIVGWRSAKFVQAVLPPATVRVYVSDGRRGLAVAVKLNGQACMEGVAQYV